MFTPPHFVGGFQKIASAFLRIGVPPCLESFRRDSHSAFGVFFAPFGKSPYHLGRAGWIR